MTDWAFSDDNSEFLIYTPYTPRPWINYLTNGRYYALVSQTGGGFSFFMDPAHHAITRREQDMLLNDRPGRFVFVQDVEDGTVWTAGGNPRIQPLDDFCCRHGFGYTEIRSRCREILTTVEFLVLRESDTELWRIRIENQSRRVRRLRVLAYQEWLLGGGMLDPIARRFDSFFNHAAIQGDVVVGTKLNWDAMQDAFGLCLLEPDRAREMIIRLSSFQYSDGSASHRAPRIALPIERSEKSDLPLWISLTTLQYVRETGDSSIVLEKVPYADGPEAPLLDHVGAGLGRSLKDVGRHGLPLWSTGCWVREQRSTG